MIALCIGGWSGLVTPAHGFVYTEIIDFDLSETTRTYDTFSMSSIGDGSTSGASSYTETDQRFGDSYNWSDTGASNAYDYEAVATHETGHSIGLAHANSSSYLSMYYQTFQGDLNQRTLARGDVLGMRVIYP